MWSTSPRSSSRLKPKTKERVWFEPDRGRHLSTSTLQAHTSDHFVHQYCQRAGPRKPENIRTSWGTISKIERNDFPQVGLSRSQTLGRTKVLMFVTWFPLLLTKQRWGSGYRFQLHVVGLSVPKVHPGTAATPSMAQTIHRRTCGMSAHCYCRCIIPTRRDAKRLVKSCAMFEVVGVQPLSLQPTLRLERNVFHREAFFSEPTLYSRWNGLISVVTQEP